MTSGGQIPLYVESVCGAQRAGVWHGLKAIGRGVYASRVTQAGGFGLEA